MAHRVRELRLVEELPSLAKISPPPLAPLPDVELRQTGEGRVVPYLVGEELGVLCGATWLEWSPDGR